LGQVINCTRVLKKRGRANLRNQNTGSLYIEGAWFEFHTRSG